MNFPLLQQMAILKGDQRDEIKHQHEKAHYAATLVHVWCHLTQPDQWQHKS